MDTTPFQWIKGAGDIGSAVAHRLRRAGLRPILREGAAPVAARRLMAFAPAVYEGEAELEGLRGVRCDTFEAALACLEDPGLLPVLVWPGEDRSAPRHPAVVVDARMRKKQQPPVQIDEAPLVVGIGPGFCAGVHAHAVVESNWGDELGRVIWEGASMDYTGRPRVVKGHGLERYLYAPQAGTFRTAHKVLDLVETGQELGRVDDVPLTANLGGILRGLAQGGIQVAAGAKLAEVDPRGEARFCIGIGDRPGRIADGVLTAIREKMPQLFENQPPRRSGPRAGPTGGGSSDG